MMQAREFLSKLGGPYSASNFCRDRKHRGVLHAVLKNFSQDISSGEELGQWTRTWVAATLLRFTDPRSSIANGTGHLSVVK